MIDASSRSSSLAHNTIYPVGGSFIPPVVTNGCKKRRYIRVNKPLLLHIKRFVEVVTVSQMTSFETGDETSRWRTGKVAKRPATNPVNLGGGGHVLAWRQGQRSPIVCNMIVCAVLMPVQANANNEISVYRRAVLFVVGQNRSSLWCVYTVRHSAFNYNVKRRVVYKHDNVEQSASICLNCCVRSVNTFRRQLEIFLKYTVHVELRRTLSAT